MTDAPAAPETASAAPSAEEDIHEQKAVRLAKRERLIEKRTDAGGGAFPVAVRVTHSIPALRAEYGDLEPGAETGVVVGVAARGGVAVGERHACAPAVQSGDVAVGLQQPVGTRDRRARPPQFEGESAFARQTLADRQAAVEDERADVVRQGCRRRAGDGVRSELCDES